MNKEFYEFTKDEDGDFNFDTSDYNRCIEAVSYNPFCLEAIEAQTEELCMIAVKGNGSAITCVKEQSQAIADAAFAAYMNCFKHIADSFKSTEMCLTAVNHSGALLQYVPDNMLTTDICLAAVNNDPEAFEWVSKKFYTNAVLEAAVKGDVNNMELIPANKQSMKLCLLALSIDEDAICYVDKSLRDAVLREYKKEVK